MSGRYLIYPTLCVARAVSLTTPVSNLKPAVYAEKFKVTKGFTCGNKRQKKKKHGQDFLFSF